MGLRFETIVNRFSKREWIGSAGKGGREREVPCTLNHKGFGLIREISMISEEGRERGGLGV